MGTLSLNSSSVFQRAIGRVSGLVDHGDLALGDPQEADGVLFSDLGDGDNVIGIMHRLIDLSVVAGALGGKEVGVQEEGQVMDSDDRFAVTTERGDEVRAMEDIEAQGADLQG